MKKGAIFLLLGDFLFLSFSLFLALGARLGFLFAKKNFFLFFFNFLPLFFLWLLLIFIFDFYSFRIKVFSLDFFQRLVFFLILSIFTGSIYFYFQRNPQIEPKTILLLLLLVFSLFLCLWRWVFDKVYFKFLKKEKVLVLGKPQEVEDIFKEIKKRKLPLEIKIAEKEEEIKKSLKEFKPDRIVVYKRKFLNTLPSLHFKIESFSSFYEKITERVPLFALKNPFYLEEILKEEKKSYLILKKIFDLFFGLVGLIILILIFPIIALMIKIESEGPVIFVQKRVGKDGKVFNNYKFRTMYQRNLNKLWRAKDKKEITKIGKILRFTHLDELPQVINILKGEMSFVGPRAQWDEVHKVLIKEIPFYTLREKALPGLTGWAQLNYKAPQTIDEEKIKLQYDLYYIKHRSFLFDLLIFLKSLKKMFLG